MALLNNRMVVETSSQSLSLNFIDTPDVGCATQPVTWVFWIALGKQLIPYIGLIENRVHSKKAVFSQWTNMFIIHIVSLIWEKHNYEKKCAVNVEVWKKHFQPRNFQGLPHLSTNLCIAWYWHVGYIPPMDDLRCQYLCFFLCHLLVCRKGWLNWLEKIKHQCFDIRVYQAKPQQTQSIWSDSPTAQILWHW